MVTVTLDEITLNAVKAALDERAERLSNAVGYWQVYIDRGMASEDTQRAYVWNVAALHETEMAREIVGDAKVVPEQADDITASKAYADLGYHDAQIEYGNREGDPAFNGAFDRW